VFYTRSPKPFGVHLPVFTAKQSTTGVDAMPTLGSLHGAAFRRRLGRTSLGWQGTIARRVETSSGTRYRCTRTTSTRRWGTGAKSTPHSLVPSNSVADQGTN
jgi:hypothetical protein